MKRYDKDSRKSRFTTLLKSSPYWDRVLGDSAINSLMDTISEMDAETVRYFEYLLQESKWNYARNMRSLLTDASYYGYKPSRRVSSRGSIIVSTDSSLASTDFEASQLDTLGSAGTSITIPVGTIIKTTDGNISFVTTKAVNLGADQGYVEIPIMQGIRRKVSTSTSTGPGYSEGRKFEKIRVVNEGFEAAKDEVSKQFLKIEFLPQGNISETTQVTIFDDIRLAGPNDWACDITTAYDFSYVEITFGDGYSGKILPPESVVNVSFIASLGERGNVSEKYTLTRISTQSTIPLYCTNLGSVLGGREHDTIEDVRALAPTQYLLTGSIVTEDAYLAAIEALAYISKAAVYAGTYVDPLTDITKEAIRFTAINTLGNSPSEDSSADVVRDLNESIKGKRSPLDLVIFEEPQFLQLRLNILAKTNTQAEDLTTKTDDLRQEIYDAYNIFQQEFGEGFDMSKFISYLREVGTEGSLETLINISVFPEATIYLKPSEFAPSAISGYFIRSFQFDSSFRKLKGFNDKVRYALKIEIEFSCNECEESSRTLFLIYNENYDPTSPGSLPYKVVQYPFIPEITSYSAMDATILNESKAPFEIPQYIGSDYNPEYIPFNVTFAYNSETSNLGQGTLSIPLKKRDTSGLPSTNYINFYENADDLDEIIDIRIIAQPFEEDVSPDKSNNIIKIEEKDILVELSYKEEAVE